MLRLIRPLNCLIASLVVFISNKITYGESFPIYAMLGAFSISAFINVTNDIFDLEVDRFNHPERPLVKGEVSLLDAYMIALIFLILGLYFSSKHSNWALLLGSFGMFLGLLYNLEIKAVPILGNILVSFVTFLAFLYGANLGNLERIIPGALLGAYLQFLREIIKSLEDKEGDKIYRKTVAHVFKEESLQYILFFGIMFLTILDVIPVFFGYSTLYGIGVFALVNLPLWLFSRRIFRGEYSVMRKVLKFATFSALFPLYFA
jgi:geranylgeranylglycerol-phosphate geranylgeranyltransferase